MALRDSLHRVADELPETESGRAERVLEVLKETAEPSLSTLENAPEGHEPETSEEAVAGAWSEHGEGTVSPLPLGSSPIW